LTSAIVIPNSVQTIEAYAFSDCAGITSITLGENVSDIRVGAFYGTRITEITIPENVTMLMDGVFENCTRLKTVYFNAIAITQSGATSPFYGCQSIETIIFGDNVRQIPANIANGLRGLESITIGRRVTTIGSNAFLNCVSIEEIISKTPRPVDLGAGTSPFWYVDKSFCILRVPQASLTAYREANHWKDFKNIEGM
jgi:hypothetical protein